MEIKSALRVAFEFVQYVATMSPADKEWIVNALRETTWEHKNVAENLLLHIQRVWDQIR